MHPRIMLMKIHILMKHKVNCLWWSFYQLLYRTCIKHIWLIWWCTHFYFVDFSKLGVSWNFSSFHSHHLWYKQQATSSTKRSQKPVAQIQMWVFWWARQLNDLLCSSCTNVLNPKSFGPSPFFYCFLSTKLWPQHLQLCTHSRQEIYSFARSIPCTIYDS